MLDLRIYEYRHYMGQWAENGREIRKVRALYAFAASLGWYTD